MNNGEPVVLNLDRVEQLLRDLDEAQTPEDLDAAVRAYKLGVTPAIVGNLCAIVRAALEKR